MTELKETKDVVESKIKTMEDNEVLPAVQSPMEIISQAVQRGAGEKELAIIERMFEFDLKVKAQQAKEAYNKAVAAFKADPPEIIKDKSNIQFAKGQNKAGYTSLGNLLKTVSPALGEHGLSPSFDLNQEDKLITVSCKLSHSLGHSESVTLSAPPDTSGGNSKNPIQQIKSTITYLRAITFEAVTGLAATDANLDDDGNLSGEPVEYVSDQQYADIASLLQEIGRDEKAYCTYKKISSIDKMPANLYKSSMTELEGWRK